MKFKLEKSAILLSEVDEAKDMANDRQWMLEKGVLSDAANICLNKFYGTDDHFYGPVIIDVFKATICKNHYQLRPHVKMLVCFWNPKTSKTTYAEVYTDLVESYEMRNGECFITVFEETASVVI